MRVSVTMDGSLSTLVAEIEARLSAAIGAGAEIVMENAKGVCPVDTGALRDSISVSLSDLSAQISANTDYAAYVEFGTSKMAAQPYLVPSLLGNEGAVVAAIYGALSD